MLFMFFLFFLCWLLDESDRNAKDCVLWRVTLHILQPPLTIGIQVFHPFYWKLVFYRKHAKNLPEVDIATPPHHEAGSWTENSSTANRKSRQKSKTFHIKSVSNWPNPNKSSFKIRDCSHQKVCVTSYDEHIILGASKIPPISIYTPFLVWAQRIHFSSLSTSSPPLSPFRVTKSH